MDIIELDPVELIPSKHNPPGRTGREMSEFRDSIAQLGILVPLIVCPTDGDDATYRVIMGHRRRTAAIELGMTTVPCIVAETTGDAEQLVTILVENVHREGLTISEEAGVYRQLVLLDWEPESIAKATSRPLERVEQSLALTKLPERAQRAADDGMLALDHIVALDEFRDDPELMERIIEKGSSGPWGFRHAIRDAKSRRDRKKATTRLRAELILAGVKVIPQPKDWPYACRAAAAETLLDANGNSLDPEQVKTRPGFAVFITGGMDQPTATVVCTDPEAWGYQRLGYSGFKTAEQRAAEEQAHVEKAAFREALDMASQVRSDFLTSTYRSAKVVKGLFVEAVRDAVLNPDSIRPSSHWEGLAEAVAGGRISPDAEKAGIDRLSRMLTARWLAKAEQNMHSVAHGSSKGDRHAALRHLNRLVADGYDMSEAECSLHAAISAELVETTASDEAESDDQEDGTDGDCPESGK